MVTFPIKENDDILDKIKYLCENDIVSYFGKGKCDGLDKALYLKSEEYKKDKIEFDNKRKKQIAFVIDLQSRDMNFNSMGFNIFFSSFNVKAAAPYYLRMGDILFPIKKQRNPDYPEFNTLSLNVLKNIRDEKSDLALLAIFKQNSVFSFVNPYNIWDVEYMKKAVVQPVGLYIVNLKTNMILADLRSYMRNTTPAVEKKMIAQFNAKTIAGFLKYHKIPKKVRCNWCYGLGYNRNSDGSTSTCTKCYGKGYVMLNYY